MRFAIFMALMLCGCATAHLVKFSKEGTTEQQFLADRFDCLKQSQVQRSAISGNAYGIQGGGGTFVSQSMYISCMGVKGYHQDPQGNFAPPADAVVYTMVN